MTDAIDPSLEWTDHFVEYGFAIRRGLVSKAYCERAVQEVRRLVDDSRPLNEWTSEKPGNVFGNYYEDPGRCGSVQRSAVLEEVFDDPGLRGAIDTMLGPGEFDDVRNVILMPRCYDPDAEAMLSPDAHMDFQNEPGPILGRGFPAQVAFCKTEPFGGNTTVWPGTHKQVQKALIDFPDRVFPDLYSEVTLDMEPFEFVAEPGDVLFKHPLALHTGNVNHCPSRMPRINVFAECFRSTWYTEVDPKRSDLSPYERSNALNGYFRDTRDNASPCRERRITILEKLE